jgi:hypothetical protein
MGGSCRWRVRLILYRLMERLSVEMLSSAQSGRDGEEVMEGVELGEKICLRLEAEDVMQGDAEWEMGLVPDSVFVEDHGMSTSISESA